MVPPSFQILLVEDDPDHALLFQSALDKANLGQRIRRVETGTEAVRYLSGEGPYRDREQFPMPSVVILDLKLPGKSGYEVLEWLRDQPNLRKVPVIILSSSEAPGDVGRAYELGANSYLGKPTSFEGWLELARTLRHYWMALNKYPN